MSFNRSVQTLFRPTTTPPARNASEPQPLGMARPSDPLRAEHLAALRRINAAGLAGYTISGSSVDEMLAIQDLHRLGKIEPVDGRHWTYRARMASSTRGAITRRDNRGRK